MTYNFDPDQWYENQRAILQARFDAGRLTEDELRDAIADLDERFDAMLDRLDGTFKIPE
jgi:hypothetical protein